MYWSKTNRLRWLKSLSESLFRGFFFAALALSCILLPGFTLAQVTCNENGQTTPEGLGSFFVLNADGVFDPMTAEYELPDGSTFDVDVLSRTQAEIDARKSEAYDFFLDFYGIDFFSGTVNPDGSVLSSDGGVILYHTAVDSRWNQRVIYSGGDEVPEEGWVVHEARFSASVLIDGYPLTGSWGGPGEPVPYGTTIANGEWVFEKVVPCTFDSDGSSAPDQNSRIHLSYRNDIPFVPDFLNRAAVEYEVETVSGLSSRSGEAIGRIELNILPGNLIEAIVKIGLRMR